MSDEAPNGRLTAAHGIQIGAIVAGIAIVGYILQPVQSDVRRIEANLAEHSSATGHPGVLADLAALKTDMAAVRAEIAGAERLTRAQLSATQERLEYLRGALASAAESDSKMVERIARVEEALRLQGLGQHLGPVPNDSTHCYSKCHASYGNGVKAGP